MQRSDLVERARRGDRDAFGQLASADVGRLYSVAQLILGAPELARDAVQDALLESWRSLPGLRDIDRYDAWQHRLLVRCCYRQRRDREPALGWLGSGASSDDPSRSVADRDEVARGFRRLTPEQRAVLVLRYYLDLSLREVAAVLGLPEGTVKSRVHRSLAALRGALQAEDRNSPALTEGGIQ